MDTNYDYRLPFGKRNFEVSKWIKFFFDLLFARIPA